MNISRIDVLAHVKISINCGQSKKASATSLFENTGQKQNIDNQLDWIPGVGPWVIRLFTVNPDNKRLFKGNGLFGCATNGLDEELIGQIFKKRLVSKGSRALIP